MRGLYAIIDVDTCRARAVDVLPFAEQILEARPCAVQLRHKSGTSSEILSLGRQLALRAREYGVPSYLNDRPDLAALCGCTGVHVGQSDLSVDLVRGRWPHLEVGVSTHSLAQLRAALGDSPSYVALGPVFATASKADAEPCVGLAALEAASVACRARGIPLVAIGGLSLATVGKVAPWADALAFIGALHARGLRGVKQATGELGSAILRGAADAGRGSQ